MNLKECPFCGSEARLIVKEEQDDYIYNHGRNRQYYDIGCSDSLCYLCEGADWNHDTPEQAADMWNRRSKREERDSKLAEIGI